MRLIPKSKDEITPKWLMAALKKGGAGGYRVEALDLVRIGEGVGILADLYRLTPHYAPKSKPGPAHFVVKQHAARPEPRAVAAAYGLYEREVRVYQTVAPTIDMGTPRCYFADFDAKTGDFIILMEDLAPSQSPDQLVGIPIELAQIAVDDVATLHARWWNHGRLSKLAKIIPPFNTAPYSNAQDNYNLALPAAVAFLNEHGFADLVRVAEGLATQIARLQHQMCAPPLTICHGDFRTDNLMFKDGASGPQLTVVDWQIAMQGRGAFDIGYLMGGHVATDMRRAEEMALLQRYHARLVALGVKKYSLEQCVKDYRDSMLMGLVYLVQAIPAIDPNNPRAVALAQSWAQRLTAAVADLDLEKLLEA